MNIMTMKWIDLLVGVPLCALLTPIAWLRRLLRPKRDIPTDREAAMLFIKMMGIGTIVLATPAIRAVRRKYPKARLHLVSFQGHRHMADNLG
ncbi:MAG TPA: glycosyltransferase family 9 protein, partial [Elusimicrobiota bacterium]|nr:glycosyltransferase family 9 protein [Elusimicrobiota bacterium]